MIIPKNQRGMSSILFAMIFVIVLTLLAIGFATLVRNDQRQTLDQTLGYQAQYAAETAVNQVRSALKDPAAGIADNQASCVEFQVEVGSGVTVPCVTWRDDSLDWSIQALDSEPVSAWIRIGASSPPPAFNRLEYTWDAESFSAYVAGDVNTNGFPNNISSAAKAPVLKVAYLRQGTTSPIIFYLVPMDTTGGTTYNYPNAAPTGIVIPVDCGATNCRMRINMALISPPAGYSEGFISISAIGQTAANVTVKAFLGGNQKRIRGAQYTIEATAIAQDIVKRVEARVPAIARTWRPGFAISADEACKDIKIDGTNTSTVSGDPLNTCPGRMP